MSRAKKNSHDNEISFERSLQRLEDIVEKLEQEKVSLDEALRLYEEGVALSKTCIDKLAKAELKLKQLSKDIDGNFQLIDLGEEDEE